MLSLGKTVLILCWLAVSGSAFAQEFPGKTIRFIVPYPIGGGYDQLAREMAPGLSDLWKQPVVVENKPGANEIVAAQAIKAAPPDGHTIMMAGTSSLVTNGIMYGSLPYDPRKDLVPITRLLDGSLLYTVRNGLNVGSINEFINYARTADGKASYGSSGNGGITHVAMAWMAVSAGVKLLHVPYKGSAPAITDMIGGTVDSTIAPPNLLVPFVTSGQIRAIGVAGRNRLKSLPDVPTVYETGNAELAQSFFIGIVAPPRTPAAVLERLAKDIRQVACAADFVKKNGDPFSYTMVCDSPSQFGSFLDAERELRGKQIAATGIRLD